jgi:hypothetical protein
LTGNQDDLDGWPTVVHRVGKLQAVDAARHLNIREKQRDIRAGLKK